MTDPGGAITVLDAGDFGPVTITQSVTINGNSLAAINAAAGTDAVVVNAGPTDTVILRGLTLAGAGIGRNGTQYLTGGKLLIDNCNVYGFAQNGIDVVLSSQGNLLVKNTSLNGGAAGIHLTIVRIG